MIDIFALHLIVREPLELGRNEKGFKDFWSFIGVTFTILLLSSSFFLTLLPSLFARLI